MRIVPNPILVRNTATYRMERVCILARKPGPLPFVPLALLRVNYLIGTLVGLFTRQIMLWAVPSPERPLSGYRRWDSGNSYLTTLVRAGLVPSRAPRELSLTATRGCGE